MFQNQHLHTFKKRRRIKIIYSKKGSTIQENTHTHKREPLPKYICYGEKKMCRKRQYFQTHNKASATKEKQKSP